MHETISAEGFSVGFIKEQTLIDLMNRGFLIYKDQCEFVLSKTPTPADPRDQFTKKFETFCSAVEFAEQKCEETPVIPQVIDASWKMELMYVHRGFGMNLFNLGEINSVNYKTALKKAKAEGEKFISQYEEGDIEKWEVKIFPKKASQ